MAGWQVVSVCCLNWIGVSRENLKPVPLPRKVSEAVEIDETALVVNINYNDKDLK